MLKKTYQERWFTKEEGKPFCVEVRRWCRDEKNRWNVYVHLFPGFPGFDKFKEGLMVRIPVSMNWGNTYCKWDRDKDGNVLCKTYGSDYMHINQDRFEEYANKESAWEVFEDAKKNWEELCECLLEKQEAE